MDVDAGAQQRSPSSLVRSSPSTVAHDEEDPPSPSLAPLARRQTPRKQQKGATFAFLSIWLSVSSFSSFILLDCVQVSTVIKVVVFASGVAGLALSFLTLKRFRLRQMKSGQKIDSVLWSIGDDESVASKLDLDGGSGEIGGEIVVVYSNGDIYQGEVSKGRCNGSGVYCYAGKGRYEGDWVEGKYEGYGIESWARGSQYCGQYRGGMRHGLGVYRFYNGDSYAGEWLGGQSNGRGVQNCSDGSCYVGEFKCGVKHGVGRYQFRNGDTYTGEYFGDKIHGFGVYNFANGHCYEGSWHEGRRQGYGTYTFRSSEKRSGEWDSGILKISLLPSEPAILRSVQAARKAVQTAALLPQVMEKANSAAAAACRAANAARVAAAKAVQHQMEGKFFGVFS